MWTGLCFGFSSNLCMAVFYTREGWRARGLAISNR